MNLFTVSGIIELQDNASKALDNATESASNFTSKLNNAASKLNDAGKKLSKFGGDLTKKVTAPIAAIGTASFLMAAEVQDAAGAVEQVFSKQHEKIKEFAKELPTYYGIAQGEALEMSYLFGSMIQTIGKKTEEEAANMSTELIKLSGDMAAMYGGSTQEAASALQSMLSGNTQALKRYGVALTDGERKAWLLANTTDYNGKAMTEAQKQMANYNLTLEQLGFATGQAELESDGASGSIRTFQTELKNLSAELGEVLIPIITPFIQGLSNFVSKFGELDEGAKKMIVTIAGILAVVGPTLIIIGKFATAISAITGLFAAGTVGAGILSGALAALGSVIAFITSPIGLVIAAVVAVIAIFTVLYKKSEVFRDFIHSTFEDIKNAIIKPIEVAKNTVSNIVDSIKGFFSNMKLSIPKIQMPKLPKFAIEGGFSLKPLSVPKISVNWNKDGGIFDEATIFNTNKGLQGVGEAGAEAILPLDKLKDWVINAIHSGQVAATEIMTSKFNPVAPQLATAGANYDNSVVNINITGDWTVDSDERQESLVDELSANLLKVIRGRGMR